MMADFVWQQFLMFCLRNGLYYGSTGDTLENLKCNPTRKIVRCLDPMANNEILDGETNYVMVVGSLERAHTSDYR